jgi:iron complex outermembrane receptor protein
VELVANVKPVQWLTVGTVLGYMDGRQDLKNVGDFKDKRQFHHFTFQN